MFLKILSYCLISSFYIKPQPTEHLTQKSFYCLISSFYIKPQLTAGTHHEHLHCLISSFYIKPQPYVKLEATYKIVLYRLSTSNHNCTAITLSSFLLSYIVFLHQTTTLSFGYSCGLKLSYIVFLHQTTTCDQPQCRQRNCLISSFYIKPQLSVKDDMPYNIVLYRLSTSNHNLASVVI